MTILIFTLMVVATFNSSLGQLYFKRFSQTHKKYSILTILDRNFIIGITLFVSAPLLTFFSLKWGEFSAVYSLTSLSYIFVLIISKFRLKEKIDKQKVIGTLVIVIGIILFNW